MCDFPARFKSWSTHNIRFFRWNIFVCCQKPWFHAGLRECRYEHRYHKTTEKSVVFIFYDITYDINIPFLRRNQLSTTLFLLICKKSRYAFTVCLSTRSSRISLHQLLRAVIKKYILSMISSVAFHPISRKLPWWVAIFLLPERKYQCRQPMVWNCREISGFFILWYLS